MKTTLTVDVDYDPKLTDPEGLACAMDRLLETALSTPGILEDYGTPAIGEFFVAAEPPMQPARAQQQVVLDISGGVLQDVHASDQTIHVVNVDWDCDGCEPGEEGMIEITDARGRRHVAAVAEYPVSPLAALAGTNTRAALQAAGIDWSPDPESAPHIYTVYRLRIDPQLLLSQRGVLLRVTDLARRQLPYTPAPGDGDLLDGLLELTDAIADQAGG